MRGRAGNNYCLFGVSISVVIHILAISWSLIFSSFKPISLEKDEPISVDFLGFHEEDRLGRGEVGDVVRVRKEILPQLIKNSSIKPPSKNEATKDIFPNHGNGIAKEKALARIQKSEALSRLLKEKARKKGSWSKKEESPAGPVRVEGSALGSLDGGGDKGYAQILKASISHHYVLPESYRRQNYKAEVRIILDKKGHLIQEELIKLSGDPHFDRWVLSCLHKAAPFPPPPPTWVGRWIFLPFHN